MGFFDFVKSKTNEGYSDEIMSDQWVSNLNQIQLSNEIQAMIYDGIRKIQTATQLALSNPSQNAVKEMQNSIKEVIENGKQIEKILFENHIKDIKTEHLVAGFYISNLCDTTLRKPDSFSDNEIKNTFATMLIGSGCSNTNVSDISSISIEKVRQTTRWIFSHPTE